MHGIQNIEVELKFPLLNCMRLIEKLNLVGHLEKNKEFQRDTYYVPSHRNFLAAKPVSEWLRLRETGNGASLNYKRWHNSDGSKTVSCDEFETEVEDVDALKKIFANLEIKEVIVVEKVRTLWKHKQALIAIDEVKDLGVFLEIEANGNFSNVDKAKEYICSILNELCAKVGEQDFEGYPYLMLKKKGLIS